MPEASAVRQPNTRPRPTAVSPNAVSWANRPLCAMTVCCMKSRKNPTGFPSAYFPTSSGITCSQRSDALGTGRNPHSSVTDSFVNSALANQTPTAIRRTASQRSGERIAGAVPASASINPYPPRSRRPTTVADEKKGGGPASAPAALVLQSRLLGHRAERVDAPVAVEEIHARLAEIVGGLLEPRAQLAGGEPIPEPAADKRGHAGGVGHRGARSGSEDVAEPAAAVGE